MGAEASCTLTVGGKKVEVKAFLETDALLLRGSNVRLSIPYARMSAVKATSGSLRLTFDHRVVRLELGAVAEKWAERIVNPPTRADKLGVKPNGRVLLVGCKDPTFRRELKARGAAVTSRAGAGMDMIFL